MASTIIHLAVAKKMEDQLNLKRKNDFYLGVIAPDLSKQIGKTKEISHLLINTKDNVPNMELFEYRHKDFRDFDFDSYFAYCWIYLNWNYNLNKHEKKHKFQFKLYPDELQSIKDFYEYLQIIE